MSGIRTSRACSDDACVKMHVRAVAERNGRGESALGGALGVFHSLDAAAEFLDRYDGGRVPERYAEVLGATENNVIARLDRRGGAWSRPVRAAVDDSYAAHGAEMRRCGARRVRRGKAVRA